MGKLMSALKNAVLNFIDQFGPQDSVAIYNFDDGSKSSKTSWQLGL